MFHNFDDLVREVKNKTNKTVVVAAAHTPSAIQAAVMAKKENLADCILTGNKALIEKYLGKKSVEFAVYDTEDNLVKAARKAVQLVNAGKADLIMKGKCDTGTLLRAVLDKSNGLRIGKVMSDVLVFETPTKLILMGDGGFLPLPDLQEKISIIQNCVNVAHSLGNPEPKVALLTHSETVNSKIQSTVDAAVISQMNSRGQLPGCIVEGPLAFDNAINIDAAKMKGINSKVAGNADILIVPNIEAGNIFGKSLTYYSHFRVAHVAIGAKVPILITSRVDNAETKFLSMALGIISTN